MHLSDFELILIGITLVAALVNGGLGYGFSSITTPVGLLWVANQVLNPVMVLVELCINLVAVAVNARAVPRVFRRVSPMLLGILPGVLLGSYALAVASHGTLRLATYLVLLPLVLLQAAGIRRPIRNEAAAGVPLGAGIGVLYAATTICGPPLSLLLNNQGYSKDDFRAALALFRAIESLITTAVYLSMGLFTAESVRLAGVVSPSVLVGVPLGFVLLRKIPNATFRLICMGADVLIVGFGLTRALGQMEIVAPAVGGLIVAAGVALLWRRARTVAAAEARS